MDSNTNKNIESAEIVLTCANFDAMFEFFVEQLKFKIFSIFPADNPSVAVVFGYGLQLRLEKSDNDQITEDIEIRLKCDSPENIAENIILPDGVKIKFIEKDPEIDLKEFKSKFVLNKFAEDANWIKGRADMRYRDLIPGREGGNFIASHIHIPNGGKVPDYVHFHNIHFQIIYCQKGWAKLVYEDQGKPFKLKAGDCVLQPPKIRHRVLESSDNLEVIEVSSPAEHETFAEHKIILPTKKTDLERDYRGQRFVRHIAEDAIWQKWRIEGFECRDTGISDATNGLASVKVIRQISVPNNYSISHDKFFYFLFILDGKTRLIFEEQNYSLEKGDSVVIPSRTEYSFLNCSNDFEGLEVML